MHSTSHSNLVTEDCASAARGATMESTAGRTPSRPRDRNASRRDDAVPLAGDGRITRDELPDRMERMVDRLDTNGDDVIDTVELEAMTERMRQRPRR